METFIQKTAAIIQLKRAGNSDLEIVKAMYQAWNIPEHRTREILEQVRDKAADTRGHGLEQYHSVSDWFPELHGERAFNGLFTEEKYLHLLNVLEDAIGGGNYRLAYWFFKEKNFEDLHRIIVYHQVTLRERGALDFWLDGVGEWYFRNEVEKQEFRGGQWHGQHTRFRDGKIFRQGSFANGKRHGKFQEFLKSGDREETVYNDGVIVSSIVFNIDNSVKSKTFYKEGHKLLTQHFKGTTIIKEERFY